VDDEPNEKKRKGPPPNRFVLSTDALPAHLDSRARQRLWMEQTEALIGTFDLSFSEDDPFESHNTVTYFGGVQLADGRSTIVRLKRTAQNIAADGSHDFALQVNFENPPSLIRQRGQELELTQGSMAFIAKGEVSEEEFVSLGGAAAMSIPRALLSELIQSPDDLVMRHIDPDAPTSRFLKDYMAFLFQRDDFGHDPALTDHIGRTLADLLALALGASRDAAELAAFRGLRAAQLQLILADIDAGFSNPKFSARDLSVRLGLSQRSIQNLLSETGRPFSERVLELRLQKARKMLSDPQCGRMKVGEIAFASGFADAPHFNRCFRRRFGTSPTQYRP